jgi:hypothetical protein
MERIHYEFMRLTARIAAPIMRITGFRFSKAWRGNRLINHGKANRFCRDKPILMSRPKMTRTAHITIE